MIIKFLSTIILFLGFNSLSAQEHDRLKLEILNPTYLPHQIKYVSINHDTITKNRIIDSIYTRIDYYKSGNIRAKYKVIIKELNVTSSSFDSITKSEKVIITKSTIEEPFGKVQLYHDASFISKSKSPLKTSAKIKNNKVVGIFLHYPLGEDILIRANFNEKGELEGRYEEYYNVEGNYDKLKCTGQFGEITTTSKVFNPDLYSYSFSKVSTHNKVREWLFYDELGNIEGRVIYDWKNK